MGARWRDRAIRAAVFCRLSGDNHDASLPHMDAEASPSRSISSYLRGAFRFAHGAWSHAARLALDIALPTLCVACREPVAGEGVCAACWAKLSFIEPPYCPRLGIPFVYDPGPDLLSMEAIANPPAYARARAAVRYDDVARTLVHALKYQDRTDLAPAMGRWMARAGRELLGEADALIPVPLHWRRGWSRRYNQSGALARVIARQTGVKVAADALRRVRPTQQQIGLSRSQRASNVQGAFKVAPDRTAEIQGRRLILIDDVLTSGATTDACARALLRARAASVDVLVFARVVDTYKAPI
jgi:ComF family protein